MCIDHAFAEAFGHTRGSRFGSYFRLAGSTSSLVRVDLRLSSSDVVGGSNRLACKLDVSSHDVRFPTNVLRKNRGVLGGRHGRGCPHEWLCWRLSDSIDWLVYREAGRHRSRLVDFYGAESDPFARKILGLAEFGFASSLLSRKLDCQTEVTR